MSAMKQLGLFGHQPPPEPPPLPDEAARRRIREDLDATLFVEAAAGTGKTTELVRRIIALLGGGRATLARLVALTFTDKAAGELKLRLREEIERARQRADEGERRARFDRALRELETAQISTIHSFCADLLRERPIEAGVDPLFDTADEEVARRLLGEAFEAWFSAALEEPGEGVRRFLRRKPAGRQREGARAALRTAAERLVDHRDFPGRWTRSDLARGEAIDALCAALAEVGALAEQAFEPEDYLTQSLQLLARFVAELRAREASTGRDDDGAEARLRQLARHKLWNWKGRNREAFGAELSRTEVLQRRGTVQAELDRFIVEVDADLAALLQDELWPVVARYEQQKARRGVLDFLDLLLRTRDLVRDRPDVRRELQQRYSHFLVDEFQDTDPLQAELLLLLAADDPDEADWAAARPVPGKLFLVGDPKQSIYRFRRADVALYEAIKERLRAQGGAFVELTTSFRSVPPIQQAVNAAFGAVICRDAEAGQAGYVPLQPHRGEHHGQPAVIALPVPRPYALLWGGRKAQITKRAIEESYPEAVGAFVRWLVEQSGWTVTERERPELRVPVEPRHVCLLFRRFTAFFEDVTRPYVRALEARRVPHVLVGGRSFHDREEVLALRNAIGAIEHPDDELRVYATLRGPLFAFDDDALLVFRARHGRLHPLRALDAGALATPVERGVADGLAILGALHPLRNRRPIAATLLALLRAVRAHAGIAAWPTGEQALANVLQLVDLARRFEAGGATSFRAFFERLEEAAESGEAPEAPVVEEGTEGVRMMTVHKAKGLEFPVVVLVDPTAPLRRRSPSRHVDPERGLWAEPLVGCAPHELLEHRTLELRRDAQEELRLAYVAATRARDLLVVPALGDLPADPLPEQAGWLEALDAALRPAPGSEPEDAEPRGCPVFGRDTVIDRPRAASAAARAAVKPGLHRPAVGEHRVVWWDPAALDLEVDQRLGLRQERLVEAADAAADGGEGVAEHARWEGLRAARLAAGGAPSRAVTTVTEAAAGRGAIDEPEIELCQAAAAAKRPGGRRFGTLVHAVLAAVPLDAEEPQVRAAAVLHGRMIGAPEQEVDAAVVATRDALAHPLIREATASARTLREVPVIGRGAAGELVEGVVDLAFRHAEGGWVAVDFKTDRTPEEHLPEYRRQVALYVRAIAEATGEPARGALLVV